MGNLKINPLNKYIPQKNEKPLETGQELKGEKEKKTISIFKNYEHL